MADLEVQFVRVIKTAAPAAPAWQPGGWGECSLDCGSGEQTRQVLCKADGVTVPDANCADAKPATTQQCNTQACTGGASRFSRFTIPLTFSRLRLRRRSVGSRHVVGVLAVLRHRRADTHRSMQGATGPRHLADAAAAESGAVFCVVLAVWRRGCRRFAVLGERAEAGVEPGLQHASVPRR